MRFGGVVADDDVELRLGERELRCLIGPNGAGKSTFFKCLTGSSRRRGASLFRGRAGRRPPPRDRPAEGSASRRRCRTSSTG